MVIQNIIQNDKQGSFKNTSFEHFCKQQVFGTNEMSDYAKTIGEFELEDGIVTVEEPLDTVRRLAINAITYSRNMSDVLQNAVQTSTQAMRDVAIDFADAQTYSLNDD